MKLFAALPYLELAHEKSIQLGPVLFWPISRYASHIDPKDHEAFRQQIHSIEGIDTCVSIDEAVDPNQRETVLIEALYLLYFICIFRNVYYYTEIPPFDAVRGIIKLSKKEEWALDAFEIDKNKLLCISYLEEEIGEGLGKAFSSAYLKPDSNTPFAKRLLRAIRFFVDRYIPRLMSLGTMESSFQKHVYEPEDFLLLSMSFEALFELNHQHPAADFKQKLRPLLHLKYSRPLELFWKWIEQFYESRYAIVHGNIHRAALFTANPNFSVPIVTIGSQLFIYSVYYSLLAHNLINALEVKSTFPPDFKWIHPEKVLLFFWTEIHLLQKIHFLLQQWKEHSTHTELKDEIHFLARLFMAMQERATHRVPAELTFIPTPTEQIQDDIMDILILSVTLPLPEGFVACLTSRLTL